MDAISPARRFAYAIAVSLLVHFLFLVAVFGGLGGGSGPFRMPGILFVELISLGSRGAKARMSPMPTEYAQEHGQPDKRDSQKPLPALDKDRSLGKDPVLDKEQAPEPVPSGENPAGLRRGESEDTPANAPEVRSGSPAPVPENQRGGGEPRTGPAEPTSATTPSCLSCPAPAYPALAEQRGIEGEVVLKIEVLADGSVGDVFITSSSGFPILDDAALARAKTWTFHPAIQDGTPVSSIKQVRIPFRLPVP